MSRRSRSCRYEVDGSGIAVGTTAFAPYFALVAAPNGSRLALPQPWQGQKSGAWKQTSRAIHPRDASFFLYRRLVFGTNTLHSTLNVCKFSPLLSCSSRALCQEQTYSHPLPRCHRLPHARRHPSRHPQGLPHTRHRGNETPRRNARKAGRANCDQPRAQR